VTACDQCTTTSLCIDTFKQDHTLDRRTASSTEGVSLDTYIASHNDSESELSDITDDESPDDPVLVDHHETTTLRSFIDCLSDPTACLNGLNLPGRREGPVNVASHE
jgi:hypothetical protein